MTTTVSLAFPQNPSRNFKSSAPGNFLRPTRKMPGFFRKYRDKSQAGSSANRSHYVSQRGQDDRTRQSPRTHARKPFPAGGAKLHRKQLFENRFGDSLSIYGLVRFNFSRIRTARCEKLFRVSFVSNKFRRVVFDTCNRI